MRPQPLLVVNDVEASSRWYQKLLGCQSDHGGKEYERLVTPGRGKRLILQLHAWEVEHDHGGIGDARDPSRGNGVLLWFEVDDFDRAVARSKSLRAEVVLPEHRNPPEGEPGGPAHRELWLRDPNGYTVVLASPDGESPLRGAKPKASRATKRARPATPKASRTSPRAKRPRSS